MIKGQAELNDAQYIDTYTDSIGHDVCKLPPDRWFEGVVPTEPAYPLHPNAKGEASMARSAIAQLGGDPGCRRPPGGAGGQEIEGRPGAQCLAAHPRVGRRARRPGAARAHAARAREARARSRPRAGRGSRWI